MFGKAYPTITNSELLTIKVWDYQDSNKQTNYKLREKLGPYIFLSTRGVLQMSKFFLDCVACHSSKIRKIDLENYQIFTCSKCRLQWVKGDLQEKCFKPGAINLHFMSKESIGDPNNYEPYQEFFTYIEKLYPNRSIRILDIGCGSGYFVEYALYRGHDCMGIEMDNNLDQTLPESIRQRIKITSIENFQIDKLKSFDVITFWDCFEHLKSPFQILDKIKTSLNTNGTVFLRVNNRWDVYNLATDFLVYISLKWHKKLLINCFGSETGKYPHYWNFSKRAMFTILERKGWTFIHHRITETPARRLTKNKFLILLFNCAYVFNRMIRGGKSGEYYVRKA